MTPEQFMDCRLALRALRRVKRHEIFIDLPGLYMLRFAITHIKGTLPEYRAMVEAKRLLRERVRLQKYHTVQAGLVEVFGPTIADRRREYHAARERFIERIGGRG